MKPLLKFAKQMGIHWFVLTDGELLGRKYAEMVHVRFRDGFSHIKKQQAYGSVKYKNISGHCIIRKAIHKISKPDRAVAICDDAKSRGIEAISRLLIDLFSTVVALSQKEGPVDGENNRNEFVKK